MKLLEAKNLEKIKEQSASLKRYKKLKHVAKTLINIAKENLDSVWFHDVEFMNEIKPLLEKRGLTCVYLIKNNMFLVRL